MSLEKSSQKLIKLYQKLLILQRKEEKLLQKTEKILEDARFLADPRREFNNWLQSKSGKAWKQKKFEEQKCKCAYCHENLRFEDAVVHHIYPLKDYGASANKVNNFKLLHPSCNRLIGTKIVNFS